MSDFGEFSLMYKRSDSADLVTNAFSDVFDKYQFISNNLECINLTIPAASSYVLTTDPKKTVLFAIYVLRDVWPAAVQVDFTSPLAGANTIIVKGLNNDNLPKPESETGSFMIFPQIDTGTSITLTNLATDPLLPIEKSTFYLVTT